MDEPCDWDVCTEASTPGSLPQLVSRTERKRHVKAEMPEAYSIEDQTVEHSGPTKPEKTCLTLGRGAHGDESPGKASPASPAQLALTRKQLQDNLPKIPPLSSFKSCRPQFITFEEAKRDFDSFISTGLGRSVEVIREFRGGEDDGQRESIMLSDDTAQSLTQNREFWKPSSLPPKSNSGSLSSQSDTEKQQDNEALGGSNHTKRGERRAVMKPQTDARNTKTVAKPKSSPKV